MSLTASNSYSGVTTVTNGFLRLEDSFALGSTNAGTIVTNDASLGLLDYEDQELVLGPVTIGAGCTLDTRARMAPHSAMEPGSVLASLAMAAGVALAAVFAGSRRDWRAGWEASLSIGATGRHPAAVRERVVASKAPTEPLRLRFRTCR